MLGSGIRLHRYDLPNTVKEVVADESFHGRPILFVWVQFEMALFQYRRILWFQQLICSILRTSVASLSSANVVKIRMEANEPSAEYTLLSVCEANVKANCCLGDFAQN